MVKFNESNSQAGARKAYQKPVMTMVAVLSAITAQAPISGKPD